MKDKNNFVGEGITEKQWMANMTKRLHQYEDIASGKREKLGSCDMCRGLSCYQCPLAETLPDRFCTHKKCSSWSNLRRVCANDGYNHEQRAGAAKKAIDMIVKRLDHNGYEYV